MHIGEILNITENKGKVDSMNTCALVRDNSDDTVFAGHPHSNKDCLSYKSVAIYEGLMKERRRRRKGRVEGRER